jgi:hypothetical protein
MVGLACGMECGICESVCAFSMRVHAVLPTPGLLGLLVSV